MNLISKRVLLCVGVCLLAGVVSAWAQQDTIIYSLSTVPNTVASTGDSEVLGSVHIQVTGVSEGTTHASPDVISQAFQLWFPGLSCDDLAESSVPPSLTFGGPDKIFNDTSVTFATTPVVNLGPPLAAYGCEVNLDVNLPVAGAAPFGLPAVGDWFQVDGIRVRMELTTPVPVIGTPLNGYVFISSSVGAGSITAPSSGTVATPQVVLTDTVTPGTFLDCIQAVTAPATITVTEPYQADFVDYTLADPGPGTIAAWPLGGRPPYDNEGTSGTKILLTVNNVPAGVTVTFPAVVDGNVVIAKVVSDHLVIDPTSSVTVTGGPVPNTTTVLYDYTCSNASICDTTFESFAITPTSVVTTNDSAIGTVTIQAQVVPLDVMGGVPSFTSPVNTNIPPLTIPRWSDAPPYPPATFLTIAPCATTLLFPWVANVSGFDTGLAINNTTTDYTNGPGLSGSYLIAPPVYPFVAPTPAEQGTCVLYFFPQAGDGTTVLYTTTPVVYTGETWTTMLSGTPFAGLAGYLISRCNFQYGHGFAAIGESSGAALSFAQSYLALVIPDPIINGLFGFVPSRIDEPEPYFIPDTGEPLAQ